MKNLLARHQFQASKSRVESVRIGVYSNERGPANGDERADMQQHVEKCSTDANEQSYITDGLLRSTDSQPIGHHVDDSWVFQEENSPGGVLNNLGYNKAFRQKRFG